MGLLLQTQEGHLAAIWDAVTDGMRITDANGEILRVNDAFCALIGKSREELEGQPFCCIYQQDQQQQMLESYRRRIASQQVESRLQRQLRLWDGRTLWLDTSVSFLGPDLLLTIFRDITSLKEAEDRLRKERQRLADLIESLGAGTWEWTIPTGEVIFNERWARIAGYTVEELPCRIQTWLDLVHPEDNERSSQMLRKHFAGELDFYECECRMRSKSGEWIWILDRGRVIEWTADHKPVRMVGAHIDITDRKHTETRLSEATAKIRQLAQAVEQSPVSIVLCDRHANITYVNAAFSHVTGYSFDEAMGQNPRLLKSGLMDQRIYDELWQALANGEIWRGEILNRKKNGELYWELAVIAPVLDEFGEVTAYLGVKEDITARKRADEDLRKANQELEAGVARARELSQQAEAASRAKSEFLANMSHEIRTPLNGVIGMSELLLSTNLNPEQKNFAEVIHSGGKALLTLINDILDLSRIEAGRIELEQVAFDVHAIVHQVADILSSQARAKDLDFRCSIDPVAARQFLGDPSRLRQVLLNLAGNAVKFTAEGSVRIDIDVVESRRSHSTIRFSVTDTGIGIPRDHIPRLFQKFTQIDSSTTRKHGGTGLGLAISKQLVTLMGGTIGVESDDGQGSRFWFTVPLPSAMAEPMPPTEHKTDAPSPSLPLRRGRVLVVEDNSVNQHVAGKLLRYLGIEADIVGDGEEAIAPVESGRYDLVFMDVHMPVLDGFEATRAIRALPGTVRSIPVIAMTASAMTEDRDRCLDAGMNDFISKPISITALRTILARWLRADALPATATSSPVVYEVNAD